MQLHWIDLAILAVIALSVITGLIRGFIKELIALSVWILAIWLAFHYAQTLDPWLSNFIQDKTARTVTGFIAILLGVLISGGIVNTLLSLILKRSGLSGTDRILGMGFGFVRGVFIVALLMVIIKMTSLPYQDLSQKSVFYTRFDPVVSWLYTLMPQFITQVKVLDKVKLPPLQSSTSQQESSKAQQESLIVEPDDYELSDA